MPVALLGYGRSGTSMVARMLNLCGVYLGRDELAIIRDEHNTSGYWEHPRFYDLNMRLLAHLGGTPDHPPLLAPGWQDDASLAPFYDEARRLVARQFAGRELWGWKHPPTTLVIPFWRKLLPDLRFVLCVRNPLDASASSAAHLGQEPAFSRALWLYYTTVALVDTAPGERVLTYFDDYFPDYRRGLGPVLRFLGLPDPEPGSPTDKLIAQFHDPTLKHHGSTVEELVGRSDVTYAVKELYLELLAASEAPPGSSPDYPLLRYVDTFMPFLLRAINGEAERQAAMSGQFVDELQRGPVRIAGLEPAAAQQIAWMEQEWRQAVQESTHLRQVLGTRSHRALEALRLAAVGLRRRVARGAAGESPRPAGQTSVSAADRTERQQAESRCPSG